MISVLFGVIPVCVEALGRVTPILVDFHEEFEEDVFAEGFEKQTSKLLMKHLNDGKSDDGKISLLTDTIEPNGNFSIGEEGITFTYNQYEIAAYVFGVIDILIPADEIKPYLKTGMNIYD